MLSQQAQEERATIVWESDATCAYCGADPKANDGAAIADPLWFMDTIQTAEANIAEVICPACR